MSTATLSRPGEFAGIKLPERKIEGHQSGGQGFFCVWHGLTFGRFLKLMAERPPLHWKWSLKLASIGAASVVNSLESAVEHLRFGRAIAETQIVEPPVFILGHWRSGTTLLHNLMSLDPQFVYPNMYEVLFPTHFLTTENLVTRLTNSLVPKTRPMDNMPAAWSMTQEDELALLLLSGHSCYRMMAFQGDRTKYGAYFDVNDMPLNEQAEWKRDLLYFMKKLTFKHRRAILLKSPGHTFRVATLISMFPRAKFIYIHRNPYEVYRSSLHLRRTVYTDNSLSVPNFEGYEEDTLKTYENCIRTYERTKHLIPPGQLHELRFSDLEADPLGEMRRVYEAIHLSGWEQVEPAIRAQLPDHQQYRKNSFSMDDAAKRRLYERLGWMFELYGYPSDLDEPAMHRAGVASDVRS